MRSAISHFHQKPPENDQIHFTPKSLAAYTDITRRLLLQSTPDAEQIVRSDLLNVMALEVDRAAIIRQRLRHATHRR
ncbi:hypothetical protein ACHW9U_09025 [Xylella fastidiosa]|uniref:hypothetical protein n=1 Tax=Xylella fastidiosa TaxID=2371 RepID=UPI003CEB6B58